jgi:hypothetical protein
LNSHDQSHNAIYRQEGPDMIEPRRIKSALAAALALSAIAASSAAARPAVYSPPANGGAETTSTCSEACSGAGYAAAGHAQLGPSTAASSNDFDWGDAAIGAGGAVVILLVGAGGVRVATSRRSHGAGGMDVTAAS